MRPHRLTPGQAQELRGLVALREALKNANLCRHYGISDSSLSMYVARGHKSKGYKGWRQNRNESVSASWATLGVSPAENWGNTRNPTSITCSQEVADAAIALLCRYARPIIEACSGESPNTVQVLQSTPGLLENALATMNNCSQKSMPSSGRRRSRVNAESGQPPGSGNR